MNIAHIASKAIPGDQQGVQAIVRRFAACCLIGVAAMSAAQAGPRDSDPQQSQQSQQSQRAERGQRQYDQRQGDERQRQNDEQRRNQQIQQDQQDQQNAQNNAEASRRSGRLTPDERRDLRRQINEAGADIYPNRRR